MSNRNPEARYEREEQVLPWMIEQWIRQYVCTGTVGIVRAYDPETKRSRVQPALRRLLKEEDGSISRVDRPPIINVPLRQTATGGYLVHHQIANGDVVWLSFSERGLEKFKERWGQISDPSIDTFYSAQDAVALPWGTENIQPVRSTGWLVQNEDGTAYISLDGNTNSCCIRKQLRDHKPDRHRSPGAEPHTDDPLMPVVSQVTTDSAGGTIIGSNQATPEITIDGLPVPVVGAPVASHAPCPVDPSHCAATMAAGSPGIVIDGVPIIRAGDPATCSHPATGSSDCTDEAS